MDKNRCPNEDRLRQFILGTNDARELELMAQHLELCPACERLVELIDTDADTISKALRGLDPSDLSNDRPWEPNAAWSPVDDTPSAELESPDPSGLWPESTDSDRWRDLVGLGVGGGIAHAVTQIGSVIAGKYTLIEKIGEGGMGSVYLARQTEPVKRNVALKLIKLGMDSPKVLLRFEAERQALAMMDHPNIARVFDGGTTEAGQPFLVMELVRGVPITRYCDLHRLGPGERLELFVHVCQAVQHAHQKGIIHRDLKPANVLLTEFDGRPVPKVIDFGIAKATERLLGDDSYGDTGLIVGTPMYMSPEQADPSMDIDTRTDIYALGVMLYELLSGLPPFDANSLPRGSILEALRVARDVEPARPSTRFRTNPDGPGIAAARNIEASGLLKWLSGDIGWIVMKALEKDRERRYDTANNFAADIQRFLADEPVMARPPSRLYQLRKFSRRNRAAVIAASLVAVVLLAGIVGTSLGLIEANRQRQLADAASKIAVAEAKATEQARQAEVKQRAMAEKANRQAFDALQSFTDELMEKLLGSKEKLTETEKSILKNAQKQWEVFAESKGESPEARVIRADGAAALAGVQHRLGMNAEAEGNVQAAVDLWEGLVSEFPDQTGYRCRLGAVQHQRASAAQARGDRAQAEMYYEKATRNFEQLWAALPGDQDILKRLAASLSALGNLKRDRQDFAAAEHDLRKALAVQTQLLFADPTSTRFKNDLAYTHWGLAFLMKRAHRLEESEAAYRTALSLEQDLARDDPMTPRHRLDVASLDRELGVMLYDAGNNEAGAAFFPSAIQILEQLTHDFPSVPLYRLELSKSHRDFGKVLGLLQKWPRAAGHFQKSIALGEDLVAEYADVIRYRYELGLSFHYFANFTVKGVAPKESLGLYEKAIVLLSGTYEQDHQAYLSKRALYRCHEDHAGTLDFVGRPTDAIPEFDKALALAPAPELACLRAARARSLIRAGRLKEGISELDLANLEPKNARLSYLIGWALAVAARHDAARSDELATAAIGRLHAAVTDGLEDVVEITTNLDLTPLYGRDDFKALRMKVEALIATKAGRLAAKSKPN